MITLVKTKLDPTSMRSHYHEAADFQRQLCYIHCLLRHIQSGSNVREIFRLKEKPAGSSRESNQEALVRSSDTVPSALPLRHTD